MENGFFAKRKLFHVEIIDDDLVEYPVEDLELMEPIIATVDIKPEIFDRTSEGKFTAFIKLPDNYDVAAVDFTTVYCEGEVAVLKNIANDMLVVKFNIQDIVDDLTDNTALLTITGKFDDGTLFEGFDMIGVE